MAVESRSGQLPPAPDAMPRYLWWRFLHALCWVWFKLCYRWQAQGWENIPQEGPVLVVANHQSFFDPIIVGLGMYRRPFYALARSTLFRGPVGWLIRSLNALPVERGEADISAMRMCVRVLEAGGVLLVFPEGTRTADGTVRLFAPGLMVLVRRARPRVLPVGIRGAFQVWPRRRRLPRLWGRIRVHYGRPIEAEALLKMEVEEAMEHLRGEVEKLVREG